MAARLAVADDIPELVRLGAQMFASMGLDVDATAWRTPGEVIARRLLEAGDLAAFAVDAPGRPGCLCAAAAVTVAQRLPSPINPSGLNGYVQWVCTDEADRGRGHARSVMTALLAWCEQRGIGQVDLHATPHAEPLYRSLGFTEHHPFLRHDPAVRHQPRSHGP
jgi:GNAT superfamily N-acetyltransferase